MASIHPNALLFPIPKLTDFFPKIFENECKPFVIEPTPVTLPLWGQVFVEFLVKV